MTRALFHPLRKHHLADGVVDLVRTGVVQVLALEVNLGAARVFCQPLGVKQRRRPADVVLQVTVQPRLKVGISLRLSIRRGELIERVHQGLGHEPAAERAEPAQNVRPVGRAVRRIGTGTLACVGSVATGVDIGR